MRKKNQKLSNFSRAIKTRSHVLRPEHESQIHAIATSHTTELLARGSGLSYSDCCVLNKGTVIDTQRLNHILSFDTETGIAVCQGGVTFADLFLIDENFIPAVLPGTLHATVAGGLAHDVHGKNNHRMGSIGHHIEWFELEVNGQLYHCSQHENHDLFSATIAGLGLTGIITRIAIRMQQASHTVRSQTMKLTSIDALLERMQTVGIEHDYQVAWIDFLNKKTRALLTIADHIEHTSIHSIKRGYCVPKLPIRIINARLMKQFNKLYFYLAKSHPQTRPLSTFNNPLDSITHWNRLYGLSGLIQFQAVFDVSQAASILKTLQTCIATHQATPTLAVLKYFTQAGLGMLSFTQPGFSLAIDFIHNDKACAAIDEMNQLITKIGGKIYLAKDLRLTLEQFQTMYPQQKEFNGITHHYHSPMQSNLSKRLGLNP